MSTRRRRAYSGKPDEAQFGNSHSSKLTLEKEIDALKQRMTLLESRIEQLEASAMTSSEIIVLRTISREEAKQEILELFQAGGSFFYSDISERLRLDLPLVVELCQELENEGEIGEVERQTQV